MNKVQNIVFLVLLQLVFMVSFSQNITPVIFTDRDFCVSGDTVWFKVGLPDNLSEKGNAVHVQLEALNRNCIALVVKEAKNNWAEGYLRIPDSLSTGQYFISSFLNSQRESEILNVIGKTLLVYNRFDSNISKINILNYTSGQIKPDYNSRIQINTDKLVYLPREMVNVTLDLNSLPELKNAVVKAKLVDKLAAEVTGDYLFQYRSSDSIISPLTETNGILISGKVTDANGALQKGVLVILSITGEPPYLDYYYSGEGGEFHFFLKDATGKGRIVLQAISSGNEELSIQLKENYLIRNNEIAVQPKMLTTDQNEFAEKMIQSNFINKIFNPLVTITKDTFSFPPRFSVPFYGIPTRRVIPDEFIDLPDFREISRELLPGVQYRIKNDEIVLRMINPKQNSFFADEPLKLVNGIPVFKNNLIGELKSVDISYIDIVYNERIFGDLRMDGILSISLYDKSNFWTNRVSGISQFSIDCLQPDKIPGYINRKTNNENLPDIRQNYLWERVPNSKPVSYSFYLSDLKGEIEISVEGFDNENKVFKASKIIEVK